MVTIDRIISSVQSEINDLSMTEVQPGEYYDILNMCMQKIAQETEMFLGRYITIPRAVGDAPINYVVIPETDNNNDLNPLKLQRVVRQKENSSKFVETREFSIQTVASTFTGNLSFRGMTGRVNRNAFATQLSNPDNNNTVDGSLVLIFADNFDEGEQVIIDFIQEIPFTITKWNTNPPIAVPEFMRNTLEALMLTSICKRLFLKGKNEYGSRFQLLNTISVEEISKLKSYAYNLKDTQSILQARPLNWLPE